MATNTHGGGIDQTAVIGHAPECREWKPGDVARAPLIADTTRIEAFATVDAGTKYPTAIGERSWIFKHAHIGHDAWIGAAVEISTGAIIGGFAEVHEGARVGLGAIVLPHRIVGRGATVGAGAVVTRDVPAHATAVGNPARILNESQRDPRPHTERGAEREANPVGAPRLPRAVEPSIPARGLCTCPSTVPTARAYHEPECPVATAYDKQLWAKDVLADPVRASVEMSGMSTEDLNRIRAEFG